MFQVEPLVSSGSLVVVEEELIKVEVVPLVEDLVVHMLVEVMENLELPTLKEMMAHRTLEVELVLLDLIVIMREEHRVVPVLLSLHILPK
jgi:hypothetical protein